MPPVWKIKREVKTLRDQLGALVELCLAPLRQRLSDPKIHELTRVQSGDKALGPKVALFLIYQPNGLSSSVITTCRHLALKGYSVLLISNSALENHDLQVLASFVWRFVQRVNY